MTDVLILIAMAAFPVLMAGAAVVLYRRHSRRLRQVERDRVAHAENVERLRATRARFASYGAPYIPPPAVRTRASQSPPSPSVRSDDSSDVLLAGVVGYALGSSAHASAPDPEPFSGGGGSFGGAGASGGWDSSPSSGDSSSSSSDSSSSSSSSDSGGGGGSSE